MPLLGFLGVSKQGCWWNERSLNRGLNRGRGLGLGRTFFSDSCSKLEIDEAFQISNKLCLGLAEKFSKAFPIQLDRYRGQYTPCPSAHPPIIPYWVCFPGFHALLAAHVLTIWWLWWGRGHPTPYPQPPLIPPILPPSSPPHFPPPPHLFEISHILRDYFQRQYL